MTDMIERVAQRLFQNMAASDNSAWETADPMITRACMSYARAAIAAMRDCTPAMLDAGTNAHPRGYTRETLLTDIIEAEWRVMCDAALEEK